MLKLNLGNSYLHIFLYFYLNTSHVKVKHNIRQAYNTEQINLNTSHVKVKQEKNFYKKWWFWYLNKSHVKVKL